MIPRTTAPPPAQHFQNRAVAPIVTQLGQSSVATDGGAVKIHQPRVALLWAAWRSAAPDQSFAKVLGARRAGPMSRNNNAHSGKVIQFRRASHSGRQASPSRRSMHLPSRDRRPNSSAPRHELVGQS